MNEEVTPEQAFALRRVLSPLNFTALIAGRSPQTQEASAKRTRRAIECWKFPVCFANNEDPLEAADCCLWKDIDAPNRWRIAALVRAGASWPEAIQANAKERGK